MRRIALFSCLFVLSAPLPAVAGFEWAPPMQNPAQNTVRMNEYQAPAPQTMSPSMPATQMGGYPSAPVMREPLRAGHQPPASLNSPQVPVPQARNLSKSGLIIDPYPLRNNKAGRPAALTENSVQQAMVEEAQVLNPLQLGAGMTTGAQAIRSKAPSAYGGASVPRGPVSSDPTALTPMRGGEPAPLPSTTSIIDAYKNAATPINRNYAQAVGFGRDLPLALALSQVIPSEFSHSFADNVDAGTTVTWEGGKPWNQVLNDMLRSKNLTADIRGNTVLIKALARS